MWIVSKISEQQKPNRRIVGVHRSSAQTHTCRALLLPFDHAYPRDVVLMGLALPVEAVVFREVCWGDDFPIFVVVKVEGCRFAVDVVDSLSFGEQWCC